MIRLARQHELPRLQEIERAAGAAFRDLGMAAVADDEPPTTDELSAFQRDGRAWVATGDDDQPVGYLLVSVVDDCAHVDQVSVHPSHARRGLGRALLEAVEGWAHLQGLAGLTLTAFAEVPWNAPYYERLGFSPLPAEHLGEGLKAVEEQERSRGLHAWPRVSMRRPIAPSAGAPSVAG